jgi:hypothetical protein
LFDSLEQFEDYLKQLPSSDFEVLLVMTGFDLGFDSVQTLFPYLHMRQ